MSPYKELKYNFDGIKEVLLQYISTGILKNYLSKLDEALNNDDLESVQYFLNKLDIWYTEHLGEIVTNDFVFNKDDHRNSAHIISKLNPKIQKLVTLDPNDSGRASSTETQPSDKPIVFISHKSESVELGNAFRQLLLNIGVKNKHIVFSSNAMNKIPQGEDIFDYLRNRITKNTYVVYLLSDSYFTSAACLNEMGAAWVMQSNFTTLFEPQFNHYNEDYLNSCISKTNMGVTLNGDQHCKEGLLSIAEKIVAMFDLDIENRELSAFVDSTCESLQKNF